MSTIGRPGAAKSHGMGALVDDATLIGVSSTGALGSGNGEGLGLGLSVNTGRGGKGVMVGLAVAGPVAVNFAETVLYTPVESGNTVPIAPCGSVQQANTSNKNNPEEKTKYFFIFC